MKTIEQYIETEMNGKIARKRNSPLLSLLILAVGLGMWLLLCTANLSDSLSTTCLTVAVITTALGLILFGMNLSGAMTHYVYLPSGSKMHEKKVYVSGDDYKDITDAIANGNLQALATIRPVVSSNSALRLLASHDGACALVQAGRYDTGHFEAETDVWVLTGPKVSAVAHLMK